ncbi:MAG: TrmB family transcriptional regulator [Methanoregulaceae archaeon]|jgi:sugar-specific transcriptional regulator TrmB|nr:TrmB family transcriptional regulator [Methanoregulaceae archaeon]
MDQAIENLARLGLKEYEAKIYVALVGLGEANVRSIHEVSGVPRPRIYDVLNALDAKGFIEIRQGSPLMYQAVRPDIVVAFLKKDLDTAASESVTALEALSVDARQNYSPIWYVHSDWTIQRNLERLVEGVARSLIVLCFNKETLEKFQGPVLSIAKEREVRILFPKGGAEGVFIRDGIRYFEATQVRDFFGENVFDKVFSVPINREGAIFRLECILIADDEESMLIYTQDGNRMAVIITLPFITCVQSRLFSEMIEHAHELSHKGKDISDGRSITMKKTAKKQNQRSSEMP